MANYFDARSRLPRRYVDPWQTRFFGEDPFDMQTQRQAPRQPQRTLAQVQDYWTTLTPEPPQVQRHPDHQAIRDKAYADAIAFHNDNHQRIYNQPPVENVAPQSLLPQPAPTPQPTPQPQAPAPQTQAFTPRGTPQGAFVSFNGGDPYQFYVDSRVNDMAAASAQNVPMGPSGPIGGLTRNPGMEPLLGVANVNVGQSQRQGATMYDPYTYRQPGGF